MNAKVNVNPKLDLVLERVIDVPRELVWRAWTEPKNLMPWFCPKPWLTTECEIDLRPGGVFRTLMCGPQGETHPNVGCYLEVIPNEKLVWTGALLPGFRPAPKPTIGPAFFMTAVILLAPHGQGTQYTAIALHESEEDRAMHEKMGFHEGWGIALDQLIAHARTM